jgi:hypothetical protein
MARGGIMKKSHLSTAIIVLVAVLMVLIGCAGQPATPETTTPPPESGIETPPSSGVEPPPGEDWVWSEAAGKYIRIEDGTWLWQGFQHEWKKWAHRFCDFSTRIDDIEYQFDPTTGKSGLTGKLAGNQNVGLVNDKLNYYAGHKGIKTGVAEFRYGVIQATVSGAVDEYVTEVFPQEISLDGLEKYDKVTIFMRGFSFEEVGSQSEEGKGAYPIRGFGLNVGNIQRFGSVLKFDYTVMLHPAPQPMWPNPTPDPWRYRVKYYYTLVGGNDGEFSFSHAEHSYRGPHVEGTPYPWLAGCDHPNPYFTETTITGDTPYGHGKAVWRGFSIRINRITEGLKGSGLKNKGRLVRTVDIQIHSYGYRPETAEASLSAELYFCNKDIGQNAMNTEYEGYLTLLQFQDDQWGEIAARWDAGTGEGIADKNDNYGYSNRLKPASFTTP